WDADPDTLDLRVETEEGRIPLVGKAGLGIAVPWRRDEDGTHGVNLAFPEFTLGQKFPDLLFIHDKAEVAVCRDAGGDETPWFRGPSPWGPPISPPIVLFATIIHVRDAKVGRLQPSTLSEIFADAQARRAAIEERRLQAQNIETTAGGLAVGRSNVKHLS